MELSELLERLAELAAELGLEVRQARGGAEADLPLASGVCRVRGETWVVLAASDDLERRIEVLAGALKSHAGTALERRYLPPAVRARLAKDSQVG